jgi:deoxyribonuclease-4
VAHASYLLNLASPDETAWSRSVALLQEEVSRCHRLGIFFLVVHPGSHLGSGVEAGLAQVARALDHAVAQAPDRSVTVCLEATAGQGTSVGHALEHLAAIRARLEHPARVGFCLDTAHLFAAGYDFRGRRYGPFIKQVDKILGAGTVRVLHLNDTEKPLGSRVDRHAHPGEGLLGRPGLQPLVRDPRFHDVPKIIETPPGLAPGGGDRDVYNVGLLRQWSRAGPG